MLFFKDQPHWHGWFTPFIFFLLIFRQDRGWLPTLRSSFWSQFAWRKVSQFDLPNLFFRKIANPYLFSVPRRLEPPCQGLPPWQQRGGGRLCRHPESVPGTLREQDQLQVHLCRLWRQGRKVPLVLWEQGHDEGFLHWALLRRANPVGLLWEGFWY